MLSCAALHLWIAFEASDGSSHAELLCSTPIAGQPCLPHWETMPPRFRRRTAILDQDPNLPVQLADFIIKVLNDVYSSSAARAPMASGNPAR